MTLRFSRAGICSFVVVVAASGLGYTTSGAAGAAVPTTVNVAPRTGLVDLQKVTVAGKGFSPNVQVASVVLHVRALQLPTAASCCRAHKSRLSFRDEGVRSIGI